MDSLKQYLLAVTAAAILCAIVNGLMGEKGTLGAAVRLLTGIFMILTLASPLVRLRLDGLEEITSDISGCADAITASGENSAREAMAEIIKSRTEAYILDKAESLDVRLSVQVELDEGSPPAPKAVRLNGNVSPYAKGVLSDMITRDLGIAPEDQIWNG